MPPSTDPVLNGTSPDPANRRRLVIMVKEPRPGQTKTRLARETSAIFATRWYRSQVRDLIHRLARDPRWTTLLAIAPDRSCASSRVWPTHLPRIPQGPGDLGHRIRRVFLRMPPGPVIVIGSDIPGIAPRHINAAFRSLGRHSAVIGPSQDGGYWLIGLRRLQCLPRRSFTAVRWSTSHTLRDTLMSLRHNSIGTTTPRNDVDTLADLAQNPSRRSLVH